MDRQAFDKLDAAGVAQLVRDRGPLVCGFPINGTRRWVMLEKLSPNTTDFMTLYMHEASKRHVELYALLFDHGVQHLLTPIFGPDILERGDEYMAMAAPGMEWLVDHEYFTDFYEAYQVRARFYGDYHRYLADTPYAYLIEKFDSLAVKTQHHTKHQLYYGVFAHNAIQTVADMAIKHFAEHQQTPNTDQLVEMYYGARIPPLDIFIGYEFSVFDVPLIAEGTVHLYFTAAPSPYLTAKQLRDILYDHLFSRDGVEADYATFSVEDMMRMRELYHLNEDRTFGVGAKHRLGYWYPLPQMRIPEAFDSASNAERGPK